MIPLRVAITGFLSYREQVEFHFDGAPIWMLTGDNGAGKSSVFDAITFALYGEHRGGKSNTEELINRGSDRLAVEFDFVVGDDCYRVQRAVARSGGATYQAIHLSGPSRPFANRPGAQPVPGTHTKAGLTRWVERLLGVDCKAFKMSVLLEQGKSDALLSAEHRERHDLLSQLVDLRRYQALEEAAREHQKEARVNVSRYKLELAALPPVTVADLATQAARVAGDKTQLDATRARLEQLCAWELLAQRWHQLQGHHATAQNSLTQMAGLLADAAQIEQAAARLGELQRVLPTLRRIVGYGASHARHQQEAAAQRVRAAEFGTMLAELTPALTAAQARVVTVQEARGAAQSAENRALQQISELTASMHDLETMARLHTEIVACDTELARFAADLDHQAAAIQGEVEALHHLKSVLPYLQQYSAARANWHTTCTQLAAAHQAQEAAAHAVRGFVAELEAARAVVETVRGEAGRAQNASAVASSQLQRARENLRKFAEVGSQPVCPYCGQSLSQAHLVSERARLEEELAACEAASKAAASVAHAAQQQLQTTEAQVEVCQRAVTRAEKAQQTAQIRYENLCNDRGRAEKEGTQALAWVRENGAPAHLLPAASVIVEAFAEDAPSDAMLTDVRTRVGNLAATQQTFKAVQASIASRAHHLTTRQHLASQWQPLVVAYPAARGAAIRTDFAMAQEAKTEARGRLTQLATELDEAQRHVDTLTQRVQAASTNQQKCEEGARTAERLAAEAHAYVERELATLETPWQEVAHDLRPDDLTAWEREEVGLLGAAARLDALREARSQIALVEERLHQLEQEMAEIPLEARRAVAALAQEIAQARTEQDAADAAHQRALAELQTLQMQHQRIVELAAAQRLAEKAEAQYGLLVRYLGRDYLQRFLLQQAEREIVARANEVLDHCSGGMLSMELRQSNEVGASQKAFDLWVENHATRSTQDRKLAAWLLSGSQRFRVAISLALAIGQYASQNGQRIESVIIDEGFGSLDRQGLRDMEDALRDLSGMIKRIILVSHQDDFAKAFPHRYAVRLEQGASRAELAEGE